MVSNNHAAKVIMIDLSNYAKTEKRKSFVVPGDLEVEKGDVITWESNDSNATFYFPKPGLFDKAEHKVKKGGVLKLAVKEDAPKGRYPYIVYTDNDDFAEGGSFPRIIIKR